MWAKEILLDTAGIASLAAELSRVVNLADIDRLVVDDHAFSSERFVPGYGDYDSTYAAPSGALSVNDNAVTVSVTPGRSAGDRALVYVDPSSDYTVVESRATTTSPGSEAVGIAVRTFERDQHTVIEVVGTITAGQSPITQRSRVHDPGLYTGATLASMLGKVSARKTMPVSRGEVPPGALVLHIRRSSTLHDILSNAMAYSNNVAIEQVLRTTAWRMTATPGSWENGKSVLEQYWQKLGVQPESLVVTSGSGLSHEGRFTARGLVDLVSAAHMVQPSNSGLISVLPVAGHPGTLSKRHLRAKGRLKAKTGTLNGVSCLSGVLASVSGEPSLVLSIMINPGENGSIDDAGLRHRIEEQIVNPLMDYLDRKGETRF